MTLEEFNAKFDDEHQVNFYAIGELDAEVAENQRTANLADQTWDDQRTILGFERR